MHGATIKITLKGICASSWAITKNQAKPELSTLAETVDRSNVQPVMPLINPPTHAYNTSSITS